VAEILNNPKKRQFFERRKAVQRNTSCQYCGTLITMQSIDGEHQYACPECHSTIYRPGQRFRYVIAMALASLLLIIPTMLLPMYSLVIFGDKRELTLIEMGLYFFGNGFDFIAFIVLITGIILPILSQLLLIIMLTDFIWFHKIERVAPLYLFYSSIKEWKLIEVYLISVFIAVLKLESMGIFTFDFGVVTFTLSVLCYYIATVWFNPQDIWHSRELRE
jgi:paraquat-inducible protein A